MGDRHDIAPRIFYGRQKFGTGGSRGVDELGGRALNRGSSSVASCPTGIRPPGA
jgi:hypothetical protein